MKNLLIILVLVGFAVPSFAQVTEIMRLPGSNVASVTIPIKRFDPTKSASSQPAAKEADTLRGPLSTIAADTTVWVYTPSTYLTNAADSIGQLCIAVGGALIDTASFNWGIQFGINGVADTTAAATYCFGMTGVAYGGAKASATKGFVLSKCLSYSCLTLYRGYNCFRVIVGHQVANNASANMSIANKKELYSVVATYQLPKLTVIEE